MYPELYKKCGKKRSGGQHRLVIKRRAGTTKIYENLTKEYTSQKIRIIIIKKISKEKDWIYSVKLSNRAARARDLEWSKTLWTSLMGSKRLPGLPI